MTRPLLISFSLLALSCDSASDSAAQTPVDVPDTVAANPEADTHGDSADVASTDTPVAPDAPVAGPTYPPCTVAPNSYLSVVVFRLIQKPCSRRWFGAEIQSFRVFVHAVETAVCTSASPTIWL